MPPPIEWGRHAWALLQDLALKSDLLLAAICQDVSKCKQNQKCNISKTASLAVSDMYKQLTVAQKTTLQMEIATLNFNIFRALKYCLPCMMCRQHYAAFIAKQPLVKFFSVANLCGASTKNSLFTGFPISEFVFSLHNHVNTHKEPTLGSSKTSSGSFEIVKKYNDKKMAEQLRACSFNNPLTMGSVISLFNAIGKDAICDPDSQESKAQLLDLLNVLSYTNSGGNANQCIGGEHFQHFGKFLSDLYVYFAKYLRPFSTGNGTTSNLDFATFFQTHNYPLG